METECPSISVTRQFHAMSGEAMAPTSKIKSYSTTEAARLLGISRPTLKRWCRLGKIGSWRYHDRGWRRIPASEVNRLLARQKVSP